MKKIFLALISLISVSGYASEFNCRYRVDINEPNYLSSTSFPISSAPKAYGVGNIHLSSKVNRVVINSNIKNLNSLFRLQLTSGISSVTTERGLTQGMFGPDSSNISNINEDLVRFELRIFETGTESGRFNLEDQAPLANAVLQVPKGELPGKFTIRGSEGASQILVECSSK